MQEQELQEAGAATEVFGYDEPQGQAQEATSSILDDVRAKRQEMLADEAKSLVLDIPAYDGVLAVRYTYPEGGYAAALKAAETEFGKGPDARLHGNIDLLRTCCDEVLGRVSGQLQPLLPPPKVTFDERLAEALQIEIPAEVRNRGRFIVRNLFSPRAARTGQYEGDLAVIAAGNQVYAWLSGTARRVDESLVGE